MAVFLITLVIMLTAVAAMAVGHLLGRAGIRGSCGSLAGVDGGSRCAACRRPCSRRRSGQR